MEEAIKELRDELDDHIRRFEALNTYLTGEGVKNSNGLLGDISNSLKEVSQELKSYHQEHVEDQQKIDKAVEKEVQKQLAQGVVIKQASYWKNLSKWTKALVIGITTTLVATVIAFYIEQIVKGIAALSGHG